MFGHSLELGAKMTATKSMIQRLLGLMACTIAVVQYAKLRMRPLQREQSQASQDYDFYRFSQPVNIVATKPNKGNTIQPVTAYQILDKICPHDRMGSSLYGKYHPCLLVSC